MKKYAIAQITNIRDIIIGKKYEISEVSRGRNGVYIYIKDEEGYCWHNENYFTIIEEEEPNMKKYAIVKYASIVNVIAGKKYEILREVKDAIDDAIYIKNEVECCWYDRVNFTIVEEEENKMLTEMNKTTLLSLAEGALIGVLTRREEFLILASDNNCFMSSMGVDGQTITGYKEDLKWYDNTQIAVDVLQVYKLILTSSNISRSIKNLWDKSNYELIWEREEILELTMEDLEKKFGKKVKIIK